MNGLKLFALTVVIFVFVVGVFAKCSHGQTLPKGDIVGHVFDAETGEPIERALIVMKEITPLPTLNLYFAVSGENGAYAKRGLFATLYRVSCYKQGYKTASQVVDVYHWAETIATFHLIKNQEE